MAANLEDRQLSVTTTELQQVTAMTVSSAASNEVHSFDRRLLLH